MSVNLPTIQRRTDKLLPLYQDAIESDVFVFAGAEDSFRLSFPMLSVESGGIPQ